MELVPITLREAAAFILANHRHHRPPRGWKFGIGLMDGDQLVGVIVAGRPVARMLDDGRTIEVTRCCTDGTKNASSMLYAAAWRAARAMGYQRMVTYTLETEPGTSLVAAGWKLIHHTKGGSWSRENRVREDKHPTGPKKLWEA